MTDDPILTTDDQQTTIVLDAMVRGEAQDRLFSSLRTQFDEQTALRILKQADEKYRALRDSGSLADYEYNLHFDKSKNSRMNKQEKGGVILILFGAGATAFSYFTTLPGQIYHMYFGLIAVGILVLIFSDRTKANS